MFQAFKDQQEAKRQRIVQKNREAEQMTILAKKDETFFKNRLLWMQESLQNRLGEDIRILKQPPPNIDESLAELDRVHRQYKNLSWHPGLWGAYWKIFRKRVSMMYWGTLWGIKTSLVWLMTTTIELVKNIIAFVIWLGRATFTTGQAIGIFTVSLVRVTVQGTGGLVCRVLGRMGIDICERRRL